MPLCIRVHLHSVSLSIFGYEKCNSLIFLGEQNNALFFRGWLISGLNFNYWLILYGCLN